MTNRVRAAAVGVLLAWPGPALAGEGKEVFGLLLLAGGAGIPIGVFFYALSMFISACLVRHKPLALIMPIGYTAALLFWEYWSFWSLSVALWSGRSVAAANFHSELHPDLLGPAQVVATVTLGIAALAFWIWHRQYRRHQRRLEIEALMQNW